MRKAKTHSSEMTHEVVEQRIAMVKVSNPNRCLISIARHVIAKNPLPVAPVIARTARASILVPIDADGGRTQLGVK